jgi:hypothetical protein
MGCCELIIQLAANLPCTNVRARGLDRRRPAARAYAQSELIALSLCSQVDLSTARRYIYPRALRTTCYMLVRSLRRGYLFCLSRGAISQAKL